MALTYLKQLSLRTKIVVLSAIFALMSCSLIIWQGALRAHDLSVANAQTLLRSEAQKLAVQVESEREYIVEELNFVVRTPPIQGIIRSQRNDGVDPLDGSTTELWRARLEQIFTAMMVNQSYYSQLRYIGVANNGREIVRVDQSGSLRWSVDEADLQEKGGEPYMMDAISLDPDEVRLGDISLNREHGEIDPRRIPTMRVMTPIFDQNDQLFGVVVANVNIERLMAHTFNEARPGYPAVVISDNGEVFEYDPVRQQSRMYFTTDQSSLYSVISGFEAGPLMDQTIETDGLAGVRLAVSDFGGATGLSFDVAVLTRWEALGAGWSNILSESSLLALLALLIGVGLVALFAGYLTEPLQRITTQVKDFGIGQLNQELVLPVEAPGEIGKLARAFSRLVTDLQDNQARTENIVAHSVDGMIVINEVGEIVSFNRAAEKIFDYQRSEVIGRNVKILMPTQDAQKHDQYLDFYRYRGEASVIGKGREITAVKKGGDEFYVEMSVSEFYQGETRYFGATVRDISEQRRAKIELLRQKETLEFALDGGGLGIWQWNIPGERFEFCARASGMVGLTPATMNRPNFDWYELVDPSQRERVIDSLLNYVRGIAERTQLEFRMLHTDGHYVWVQHTFKVSRRDSLGVPVEVVGIQQDITDRKRHELALEERTDKLELAESVAEMGHWSVDLRTNKLHWSEGVFRIYGIDPEWGEPELEDAIEFYHPDDRAVVEAAVNSAIEENKPFEFQLRVVRGDGEIRHVISRGELKEGSDDDERVLFGIFQDVSEKVEAELQIKESEKKIRTMMNSIVDGVVTVNSENIIEDCNPAFAKIFGYDKDELIGVSLTTVIPPEYREPHLSSLEEAVETGDSALFDKTLERLGLHKSGETIPLEVAVSRSRAAGRFLFFGIARDISERKKMETLKNDFVSTVNHELRTPLTSVYGSLDLLQKLAKDQLDERCQRLVTLAHQGCGRLSSLVNDILDLEKIAAGKMEYLMEDVRLEPLIDDIVERHEALADRFGVTFKIEHAETDTLVNLDASRFNQALVNLMSNAAKFSPMEGEVVIRSELIETGKIRVSVQDHGPGIPAGFRDRIFERFAQADRKATQKNASGSGLGLNITKSIIEAFGGEVDFETAEGEGTTFYMDIPVKAQSNLTYLTQAS